jgi:hypothetical protein
MLDIITNIGPVWTNTSSEIHPEVYDEWATMFTNGKAKEIRTHIENRSHRIKD